MEVSNFWGENVAVLYRHFDEFKSQAKYFMAELPFEVKYELFSREKGKQHRVIRMVHAPVNVGALFACWQAHPEFFRAPCSTDDKEYLIYSFNGSPFSSSNCWNAVCIETGERVTGENDRNFIKRCRCLDEAVLHSRKQWADYVQLNEVETPEPATLEELVEFVNSTCSNT